MRPVLVITKLVYSVDLVCEPAVELHSINLRFSITIRRQNKPMSQRTLVRVHQESGALGADIFAHPNFVCRAGEICSPAEQDRQAGGLRHDVGFDIVVVNHHGVVTTHMLAQVFAYSSDPRWVPEPG